MKIERPSFHQTAFEVVDAMARRSTCPRRQVGAIVVDVYNRILGTGHNGVPRNARHCIEFPCPGAQDTSGDNRRCEAIHAEANALMYMTDRRFADTMYSTCTPCFECCKLILTTPIKKIISKEVYTDQAGLSMLRRAGIRVYQWIPTSTNDGTTFIQEHLRDVTF